MPAAALSFDTSTYWTAVSLVAEFWRVRTQVRSPAGSANRWDWQTNAFSGAVPPS